MACNCEDCCKNYKTCETIKEYGAIADIYYLAANCKDFVPRTPQERGEEK